MNKNKRYSIFSIENILIILLIIIILFIIYKQIYSKYLESFDNVLSMSYQSGKSGITQTGTIKFDKPFSSVPMIFTQIIGGSGEMAEYLFNVQIFNITTTQFDYSKNKLYYKIVNTDNVNNMPVLKLEPETTQSFMWTAFG
jgi:hypothetical protein